MIALLIATIIIAWAIYGLHKLELHKPALEALSKPIAEWFSEPGNPVSLSLWAGSLGLCIASWISSDALFHSMLPDFIVISLSIIGIDRIVEYRNYLQEKKQIIQQLASRSNPHALDAARIIIQEGWHKNGSLVGNNFEGANLESVELKDANLEKANFKKANLMKANLSGANFQKTSLHNAILQGAILEEVNFQGATLFGANFQEANLFNAKLSGLNLINTNFHGAQLWCTDMQGVHRGMAPRIQTINFEEADLNNANLQKAELSGVNFNKAHLFNAKLQEADLFGANLQDANLVGAEFQGAILAEVNFCNAKMMGANLKNANLNGANLSSAEIYLMNNGYKLGGINVEGATYNDTTQWPEGFDPEAAGAIKVDD